MAQSKQRKFSYESFLSRPEVGTLFTILSGLSFLLVGMFLPLVGKAGSKVVHATANYIAFLCVVLITLGLSGMAVKLKMDRSKLDGSPRPLFSMIIFGLCSFILAALLLGLLKI